MDTTQSDIARQDALEPDGAEPPQPDGSTNKAMRAARRAADLAARREAQEAALSAVFCRVALWMEYLPITFRQRVVLGRVMSFMTTSGGGEYRMSLEKGSKELNFYDRAELQRDLNALTELGYLVKQSNGARRPASYVIDFLKCMDDARANGYGKESTEKHRRRPKKTKQETEGAPVAVETATESTAEDVPYTDADAPSEEEQLPLFADEG